MLHLKVSARLFTLCVVISSDTAYFFCGLHQDTAMLFAAVEGEGEGLKTKKTIEEVTWLMLGQGMDKEKVHFGNAGNDAYVSFPRRPRHKSILIKSV